MNYANIAFPITAFFIHSRSFMKFRSSAASAAFRKLFRSAMLVLLLSLFSASAFALPPFAQPQPQTKPQPRPAFSVSDIRQHVIDSMAFATVALKQSVQYASEGHLRKGVALWNNAAVGAPGHVNQYASVWLARDGTAIVKFNKKTAGVSGTLKLTPSFIVDGKSYSFPEAERLGITGASAITVCTSATHRYAEEHRFPFAPGATLNPKYVPVTCR
jgi:hypothetical protein